jgi:hypothetical protein
MSNYPAEFKDAMISKMTEPGRPKRNLPWERNRYRAVHPLPLATGTW